MILPHDSVAAAETVLRFCQINGLDPPKMDFRPERRMMTNHYGQYRGSDQTLVINAMRCKAPSASSYSWTWPGYTADLTVLGVTCHELGHYVNHVRGWAKIRREWYAVAMNNLHEPPVGSYAATQTIEDFAEAFKVFVTNPTLLEAIAPNRYSHIVTQMKLEPAETRHWREILGDSPRHIRAVENKI